MLWVSSVEAAVSSDRGAMKKIDVSGYLHPDERQAGAAGDSPATRPKRDITYSVVLGYGFRPSLNERRDDRNSAKEKR
jgi:hypothetical protein